MALIPAGPFEMGSIKHDDERPIHTVSLDAFYMDIYEITNARYAECVTAGQCSAPSKSSSYTRSSYYGNSQYADYPVIYVSWNDANTYCTWRGGQLPTEAEWEKAARGGLVGKLYPGGDHISCMNANYSSACIGDDTTPVGEYAPNGYGLYDMAGNVWEWVADWYDSDFYKSSPTENPTGPTDGSSRVLRGGSWYVDDDYVRVAYRRSIAPTYRYNNFGFRCAYSPAVAVDSISTPAPNKPLATVISSTETITDTWGVPMAFIPAGSFEMGSDADVALAECKKFRTGCERSSFTDEEPIHIVTLNAFYMDIFEVTNARYAECVSAGECSAPSTNKSETRNSYYDDARYADYPVLYISWDDATSYCEWRGGRLPTEAEWEYAARGGLDGKLYPWGDESPICEKGAVNGAKFDDDTGCNNTDTEPVGSFASNSYGLYDMAGNVWEWVADWYNSDYYQRSPAENPTGPNDGNSRLLRGGSWGSSGEYVRVTARNYDDPSNRSYSVGFRCAVSAPGN